MVKKLIEFQDKVKIFQIKLFLCVIYQNVFYTVLKNQSGLFDSVQYRSGM